MRPVRSVVAPFTLALLCTPASAPAQLPADTAAQVDKVFAAHNHTDTPGCVLGLDRNSQPLYRKGYGMASLELATPMTETSVVESGSVAKQFTAGAIIYLAQQGKLGLDDPVRKYIPELPDYGGPVTIRMLLHHTSGVRDMWTLFTLSGETLGENLFTMDRALRMVYRQRELNFPPNSQFLYSNSGFLLLAEIVRRTAGVPLDQFSQETFFRRLGLTRTQWRSDWNRVVPGRATAYAPIQSGGFEVDMPYMSVYGAGGLLTSVGDMLLWNEHLDAPRIGGKAWADTMQSRGRLTDGRQIDYAMGLFVSSYRGEREVQHGGATGGYRTFLARYPDRRLSLALLCNLASVNSEALAHQVVDVFIGAPTRVPAQSNGEAAAATFNPGDLNQYAGRYRAPATEDAATVSVRDGRLVFDMGFRVPMTPAAKDVFKAPEAPIQFGFSRGTDGKITSLVVVRRDRDTTRYEPWVGRQPTAAELAVFAGSYYSDELDAVYAVSVRDSTLVAKVRDVPEMVLTQTGPESFSRSGMGAFRFTRGKNGKVDGFLMFAGRVRNLRFAKR